MFFQQAFHHDRVFEGFGGLVDEGNRLGVAQQGFQQGFEKGGLGADVLFLALGGVFAQLAGLRIKRD